MAAYSGQPLIVEAPKLAQRLAAAMGSMSLRKLEEKSGVDKTTIQRWKSGNPRAEVAAVQKVAKALGTTAEFLLDLPRGSEASPPLPDPIPHLDHLRRRIAGLDPETLSLLEQTLPSLREVAEEIRRDMPGD